MQTWFVAITREHGVQSVGPLVVADQRSRDGLAASFKTELVNAGFENPRVLVAWAKPGGPIL